MTTGQTNSFDGPFDAARPLGRYSPRAALAGVVALGLCALGGVWNPEQFFRSYLYAWLFVLGIALGSLALLMLIHLTGGEWGRIIQRPAEAAAATLPLVAVLFIPVLLGLRHLFPWANAEWLEADPILHHRRHYMNVSAFTIRAAAYFAIWIVLAFLIIRDSLRYDRTGDRDVAARTRSLCAFGLLLYMFTMSLASVDWVMSREPHWYSTILGFMVTVGQAASAMVFLIALLWVLAPREPLASFIKPSHLNDLGNLFLTLVILWAYLAFAQFLITWMGNLRNEVNWYTRRGMSEVHSGWRWVGLLLIVFHFFVPFFILLSREAKRRLAVLCTLAAAVLLLRLIDNFWLVAPTTLADPRNDTAPISPLFLHWMDVLAPVGIGGLWLAAFSWLLGRRPLLPRLEEPEEPVTATGTGPMVRPNGAGPTVA